MSNSIPPLHVCNFIRVWGGRKRRKSYNFYPKFFCKSMIDRQTDFGHGSYHQQGGFFQDGKIEFYHPKNSRDMRRKSKKCCKKTFLGYGFLCLLFYLPTSTLHFFHHQLSCWCCLTVSPSDHSNKGFGKVSSAMKGPQLANVITCLDFKDLCNVIIEKRDSFYFLSNEVSNIF